MLFRIRAGVYPAFAKKRLEMQEEPLVTPEEHKPQGVSPFGLLLRASFFVLLVWISGSIFGIILHSALDPDSQRMTLLSAALGMFIPATLATTFVVRIYERGRLEDIGMGWSPASLRQFWSGAGAVACEPIGAGGLTTCPGRAGAGAVRWAKPVRTPSPTHRTATHTNTRLARFTL